MKQHWIKSPSHTDYSGALSFTKKFSSYKTIQSATLAVSAVGLYEARINNKKIGNRFFTPGFTSYDKRGIQYQEYDVTDSISNESTLEIIAAPGWAVGHFGFTGNHHIYADHVSICAKLTILYTDLTEDTIFTDSSFLVRTTQITHSDIYNGETIDKTHIPKLLGNAVSDDVEFELIKDLGEPVTEHETFKAKLITTPKNEKVLDFGQNMAGYVALNIQGQKGAEVQLSFGEVLDKDGNFYNANYRQAQNDVRYILSGGEDYFKPTFSFQGFRYVRIDKYPNSDIQADAFTAIAVHSDMDRIGHFSCGNSKINQLYHNIIWGQKSNYLDIPTDCPQRDERMGWTGDAQVFCRTAGMNFNVLNFFEKWLADLRAEQSAIGEIYGTCPETVGTTYREHTRVSAGWGDCATIIPWTLYMLYGNKQILSDNFDMMCRWVDYIHSAGSREFLWLDGWHFGDWLALDAGEDSYEGATSKDLIASAYFAYSARLVVKTGDVLGKDVTKYRKLYENIIAEFRQEYLKPILDYNMDNLSLGDNLNGLITQTAMVLILHFDLCEENEKSTITHILTKLIDYFDQKMSTGFIGTPYILHALSDNGQTDTAYNLFFNESSPSWLYSVNKGATTMWEHWNGIKEDGSFWSTDMNSFNHYAYGAVGDWIYEVVSGIKIQEAGYKKITIAPKPDKRLGFADCTINTPYGMLCSSWKYTNDKINYKFSIPDGVTAEIILPDNTHDEITGPFEYQKEC